MLFTVTSNDRILADPSLLTPMYFVSKEAAEKIYAVVGDPTAKIEIDAVDNCDFEGMLMEVFHNDSEAMAICAWQPLGEVVVAARTYKVEHVTLRSRGVMIIGASCDGPDEDFGDADMALVMAPAVNGTVH